jgi:hypothetical protein
MLWTRRRGGGIDILLTRRQHVTDLLTFREEKLVGKRRLSQEKAENAVVMLEQGVGRVSETSRLISKPH